MKRKVFGFDQSLAASLGLDITDLMILDAIRGFCESETKKMTIDGEQYSWVCYATIINENPILRLGRRMLARRLDSLASKGVVKKRVVNNKGTFTYFRFVGLDTKVQGTCNSNDRGVVTPVTGGLYSEVQPKNYKEINYKEINKEKDISDEISKKKVANLDSAIKSFRDTALKDETLAYCLRPYRITNMGALLDAFMAHVTKQSRIKDIGEKGYVNARSWLMHSIPFLDLSKATGVALGYGEYLKDGKRLYKSRNGKEIEVPMDAPPRRQGTIWYKEQGRWGPDI